MKRSLKRSLKHEVDEHLLLLLRHFKESTTPQIVEAFEVAFPEVWRFFGELYQTEEPWIVIEKRILPRYVKVGWLTKQKYWHPLLQKYENWWIVPDCLREDFRREENRLTADYSASTKMICDYYDIGDLLYDFHRSFKKLENSHLSQSNVAESNEIPLPQFVAFISHEDQKLKQLIFAARDLSEEIRHKYEYFEYAYLSKDTHFRHFYHREIQKKTIWLWNLQADILEWMLAYVFEHCNRTWRQRLHAAYRQRSCTTAPIQNFLLAFIRDQVLIEVQRFSECLFEEMERPTRWRSAYRELWKKIKKWDGVLENEDTL
jgi:hypothetical protein